MFYRIESMSNSPRVIDEIRNGVVQILIVELIPIEFSSPSVSYSPSDVRLLVVAKW